MRPILGVSLKAYFSHHDARQWFAAVARIAETHPALAEGRVECFVAPSYLQIAPALAAFAATGIRVAAQDVAATGYGPYTGEVTAAELREVGVEFAEIGHAERRRLYGESDDVITAKVAAAVTAGLTPVLCVGETPHGDALSALEASWEQLSASLTTAPAGRVLVAYEPVWAIGAAEPAPLDHIRVVAAGLRERLLAETGRDGSGVIYGGTAGPGMLRALGGSVDGLFLGRRAHDPDALAALCDEALELQEGTA